MRSVEHRHLSLWQSAVAEHLSTALPEAQGKPSHTAVKHHPMMRAATTHAVDAFNRRRVKKSFEDMSEPERQAQLSRLMFEHTNEKLAAGAPVELDSDDPAFRPYSTADTAGWLKCAVVYAGWLSVLGPLGKFCYNDWTEAGQNDINYGVVDYELPSNARVGILGDWGTSMDDAKQLMISMMAEGVDLIIHLGDIYYSGTKKECGSFVACVNDAMTTAGYVVPFLAIPGNHEYYAWGEGFYNVVLPQLNARPNANCQQEASYFCLRTQDQNWQFLAMDTGHNSVDALTLASAPLGTEYAPYLQDTEVQWHLDKLKNFSGKTILLSHHQLFSANLDWKPASGYPDKQGVNLALKSVFDPYFDTIACWIWGHEHNMMIFDGGLENLNMGRLVGASAYEETVEEDPYAVVNPDITFNEDVVISNAEGYYNHSYAILTLGQGDSGKDISAAYYEFPSYDSSDPPASLESTLLYTETIAYDFSHPYDGVDMPDYLPQNLPSGTSMSLSALWGGHYHDLDGSAAINYSESSLSFSCSYDYSRSYKGDFEVAITLSDQTNCTMKFKLGSLWNNGQDHANTGTLQGTYAADIESSTMTFSSNDGSLKIVQIASEGGGIWNANIEFQVTYGGVTEYYAIEASS